MFKTRETGYLKVSYGWCRWRRSLRLAWPLPTAQTPGLSHLLATGTPSLAHARISLDPSSARFRLEEHSDSGCWRAVLPACHKLSSAGFLPPTALEAVPVLPLGAAKALACVLWAWAFRDLPWKRKIAGPELGAADVYTWAVKVRWLA